MSYCDHTILVDLNQTEILIDGGEKTPGVVAYLNNYVDGSLEVLVATHPHADHIGGLIDVLDAFDVQQIWHNVDESSSVTYFEFITAVCIWSAKVGHYGPPNFLNRATAGPAGNQIDGAAHTPHENKQMPRW